MIYVADAEGIGPAIALPLLKRAAQLNPRWGEPIFRQAQLEPDPARKEALLKEAAKLQPRETRYWLELAHVQTDAGNATAAQGTWLRAEDSAPTGAERDRIHQLRLASEQARLDAADAARLRDREAVHLADEQAQKAELDRIHAAETRANAAHADDAAPSNVLTWNQVTAHKTLRGVLTNIECLSGASRLTIKDHAGASTQLLLTGDPAQKLGCGAQHPPRRVSIDYSADPDDRYRTAGTVITIESQ